MTSVLLPNKEFSIHWILSLQNVNSTRDSLQEHQIWEQAICLAYLESTCPALEMCAWCKTLSKTMKTEPAAHNIWHHEQTPNLPSNLFYQNTLCNIIQTCNTGPIGSVKMLGKIFLNDYFHQCLCIYVSMHNCGHITSELSMVGCLHMQWNFHAFSPDIRYCMAYGNFMYRNLVFHCLLTYSRFTLLVWQFFLHTFDL